MINMLIIWSILWYCDHWCDQNQDILSPTYKSRLTARTAAWTATWADVCFQTLHFTFCILHSPMHCNIQCTYKYWIFVILKTFDENPTVCHLFFHQLKWLPPQSSWTSPELFHLWCWSWRRLKEYVTFTPRVLSRSKNWVAARIAHLQTAWPWFVSHILSAVATNIIKWPITLTLILFTVLDFRNCPQRCGAQLVMK